MTVIHNEPTVWGAQYVPGIVSGPGIKSFH